jgi:type IV pilus assembly protein PilV
MHLNHPTFDSKPHSQLGSTLIEVLIAILIFGLGMLGMVGLLAATTKYQSGNLARVQISNSIESIGERIRSNIAAANGASTTDPVTKAAVQGTGYLLTTTFATEQAITVASIWPPALDCLKVSCTANQRETYDLLAWRAQLKQTMPSGAGNISGDSRNGFNVTIMWFDKTAVQGDDAKFIDTPIANEVCPATRTTPNPAADRFCCPASVGAPDGVRCYNSKILP